MLNPVTKNKKSVLHLSWLKALLTLTLVFPALTMASDADFEDLLDRQWQSTLKAYPTFATSLGVRDYDSELSDPSLTAYEALSLIHI